MPWQGRSDPDGPFRVRFVFTRTPIATVPHGARIGFSSRRNEISRKHIDIFPGEP